MYEELINSLRYCATHSCMGEAPTLTGCTAIYDDAPKDCDSCNAVLQWQAADAIEELQGKNFLMKKTAEWLAEKVPKWIPVTERLPEDMVDVLCYYEYFRYGNYNCMFRTIDRGHVFKGRWFGEAGEGHKNKVFAWMPLPEPPKEGE